MIEDESGEVYIRVNKRIVGRAFQVVACISAAFIPFALGALLLHHTFRGHDPDLGALIGSFAFFLNSAGFVYLAFMREDPDSAPQGFVRPEKMG